MSGLNDTARSLYDAFQAVQNAHFTLSNEGIAALPSDQQEVVATSLLPAIMNTAQTLNNVLGMTVRLRDGDEDDGHAVPQPGEDTQKPMLGTKCIGCGRVPLTFVTDGERVRCFPCIVRPPEIYGSIGAPPVTPDS